MTPSTSTDFPSTHRGSLALYLSVGMIAGAVIALQITIMRIFSVGSWAHFGSLVVSLAMLGFGLTSAVMCVSTSWFQQHWRKVSATALLCMGPLAVGSNLVAQQYPFNAIFLLSDPIQKWRLSLNFGLYLLPFLAGSMFLGVVFQNAQKNFNRVYFADLAGSGLSGLLLLLAMYGLAPQDLIVLPLLLWLIGSALWFAYVSSRKGLWALACVGLITLSAHFVLHQWAGWSKIAVSDYKGVSYAIKFPDSKREISHTSPFGLLEVYSSSYLHFAPGLSDNAAFNLPEMPANAYWGLYRDSEGPSGIIRKLPAKETAYYRYLPMFYPYLIQSKPDTFVMQFGGGISTALALAAGSSSVTVAEGDRGVLDVFENNQALRDFTGDILHQPGVQLIDYEGRLYLAGVRNRFDIVDLSLADSAGLSSPGGFAISEKYSYTREALVNAMLALKPSGILSITLWNKEEPPKSVLKLYGTVAAAAKQIGLTDIGKHFFVVSSYLSTATVLFKRDGFTEAQVKQLREHTEAMSFDEIYSPGFTPEAIDKNQLMRDYRNQIFGATAQTSKLDPGAETSVLANQDSAAPEGASVPMQTLPSTQLGRLVWQSLARGTWAQDSQAYVFDTRILTNVQPYFAAYVKFEDLLAVSDRLELLQDEWGYLLIWATLGVSFLAAMSLIVLPLIFGWKTIFHAYPGKLGTIVYFACLGLGYIMIEVSMISHFILALGNATISASVLITGMLIFSGLGSLFSERVLPRAREIMPFMLVAIGLTLIFYGLYIDRVLDYIGALPYLARMFWAFMLIAPPAFLMGFPMSVAMTSLARLGKEPMFLWAWSINGCFSVIGGAMVPVLATAFGLHSVLMLSGVVYLVAAPAFLAVLKPFAGTPRQSTV